MLRRKKTKITALLLSLVMIILLFVNIPADNVGVYQGCAFINRLTYSLFHAGVIHLSLNLWCFLSCVFLADITAAALMASFLIAFTVPVYSDVPTVGLSGVCYALLGFIMLNARNKISYNVYILTSIIIPYIILPHAVNSFVHAYCYVVAIALSIIVKLFKVFEWRKR